MKIHSLSSQDAAAQAAQQQLYTYLTQTPSPILLLVSGGSALTLLNSPRSVDNPSRITIGVLDERFSTDPNISNYLQLQKTPFYSSLTSQGSQTLNSLPLENEPLHEWAKRLELEIHGWQKRNPSGELVITLGMGTDGHTAGIFPSTNQNAFDTLFMNTSQLFHAYYTPAAPVCPSRLTAIYPLLAQANKAIAFVCGENKEAPLARALHASTAPHETPAHLFTKIPNLDLFTDIRTVSLGK